MSDHDRVLSKLNSLSSRSLFVLAVMPALALACGGGGDRGSSDEGIDDELGGDTTTAGTEDTADSSTDGVSFDIPDEVPIIDLIIEPANPVI